MKKEYYIYEWFNIDTNIVFYVGKGKGTRKDIISGRNKYFINYYNKYNCTNRIVLDNLTEKEAFEKEIEKIKYYKLIGQCFCNITDGGEQPPTYYGEKNAMHGRPWWDEKTPKEKIEKWKMGLARKGEQNGQYGVSPRERMDKDTYNLWREKHKTSLKGERNPQYGKSFYDRMDEDTYSSWRKKHSEAQTGGKNTTARRAQLLDSNKNIIKQFDCIKHCCEYLIENGSRKVDKNAKINNVINNMRININKAFKNNTMYLNYYYKIS